MLEESSLSHVLRMGWPILFFLDDGLCLVLFLEDLGGSGAETCPYRVWKVPKETARTPNEWCLL